MELDTRPNPGWWYVMTTAGDHPSVRVGHTAVHVRGMSDGDAGKLYVIGGANPSGPFCETFVLDLNTRCWDIIDSPGLRPRYEHAAYVPDSKPGKIYVFGGASQAGNMNDLQVLDTCTGTWSTLAPAGSPPAPRTHHTTASVGDRLIVYSGGHAGADPVGDRQVHCFDAASEAWSVLTLLGDSPKPRHGHAMAVVGQKVFVHGGMAGSTFYDDLHVLDLERKAWSSVKKKRSFPCSRAAHGMMTCGTDVYVFGGMNRDGALDDLHKLDTTSMTWTRIELQGPAPACRLDMAVCMVELRVPQHRAEGPADGGLLTSTSSHAREVLERELKPGSASSRDSWTDVNALEAFFPIETAADSSQDTKGPEESTTSGRQADHSEEGAAAGSGAAETPPCALDSVRVLLLNGGMDTEGEMFDDTLVFLIS